MHLLLYLTNSAVHTYKVFNTYLIKLCRRNCDTLHFSLWFAFACKCRPGLAFTSDVMQTLFLKLFLGIVFTIEVINDGDLICKFCGVS